jgi:hypothetical protein
MKGEIILGIMVGRSVFALSISLLCVGQVALADQECVVLATFGDWNVAEFDVDGFGDASNLALNCFNNR